MVSKQRAHRMEERTTYNSVQVKRTEERQMRSSHGGKEEGMNRVYENN